MNFDLLPQTYRESYHHRGNIIVQEPKSVTRRHCYYHGKVRGVEISSVAVSTCHGINGMIFDGHDALYIYPEFSEENNFLSHLIFWDSEKEPNRFTCGNGDSVSPFKHETPVSFRHQRGRRDIQQDNLSIVKERKRYVELVIVNDNAQFRKWGNNKDIVFERSKQVANILSGIYSPLNIVISLMGVVIWSEHDEILVSSDSGKTLENFSKYRRENLLRQHPNDNAQLITGLEFENQTVGKGTVGTICTYKHSAGVVMDHNDMVGLVGSTMAHELGHNFGMQHDKVGCECPEYRCVMSSMTGITAVPKYWSSCSIEDLIQTYQRKADICLWNVPLYNQYQVCGDGVLDEGEECDCGLKEYCTNPCCNASTCKLFVNATCSSGECCDTATCKLKPSAAICRKSRSECDLPEFCNGESQFCPEDISVQDGRECGNGKAYCYHGQCRDHNDQCRRLWGDSQMGSLQCFKENKRGYQYGNCGYQQQNQSYIACEPEDILCGLLHCSKGEDLVIGSKSSYTRYTSKWSGSSEIICVMATVDMGLTVKDPGQSPDGAKCGKSKMCHEGRCVDVTDIITSCPYNCYGNGLCNSKGNCHCNEGYGPPYCNRPGYGGSIDSGPATRAHYGNMLIIYIMCLGVLPLLFIICLVVYCLRTQVANTKIGRIWKTSIITNYHFFRGNSNNSLPGRKNLPKSTPPNLTQNMIFQKETTSQAKFSANDISIPWLQTSKIKTEKHCIVPVRPAPPLPENKQPYDLQQKPSMILSGSSSTPSSMTAKTDAVHVPKSSVNISTRMTQSPVLLLPSSLKKPSIKPPVPPQNKTSITGSKQPISSHPPLLPPTKSRVKLVTEDKSFQGNPKNTVCSKYEISQTVQGGHISPKIANKTSSSEEDRAPTVASLRQAFETANLKRNQD
ncbi:zinc metalloproteinase-disintegrin-like MTP4 isoform X3 [Tachypleus tridentatus]